MPKRNGKATSQKERLSELTQLLGNAKLKDLKWRHEVGMCIDALCPERAYGEDQIGKLRASLPPPGWSAAELRKMRDFARKYTDKQVADLLRPRNGKDNFRFAWSHVCCLLRLEIKDRERLQQVCRTERWPYERLLVEVRSMPDERSQSGRQHASPAASADASASGETPTQSKGRKHAMPTTIDDALSQLMRETSDWQKRYRKVWFEGEAILGGDNDLKTLSDSQLLDRAIQCMADFFKNAQNAEKQLAAIRRRSRKKSSKRITVKPRSKAKKAGTNGAT